MMCLMDYRWCADELDNAIAKMEYIYNDSTLKGNEAKKLNDLIIDAKKLLKEWQTKGQSPDVPLQMSAEKQK